MPSPRRGSRGRGAIGSLVLGTVSAAVAARATCPTVVGGAPAPLPDDPVVVGIDGTRSGEAAVGYAFAAADREGVPLVAVHVWQDLHDPEWGSMLDDDVSPSAAEGMPDLPEAELLAERLAGWSSKFPDVEVFRVLPEGRPVPTLVARSGDARLVVVGSHRRQGLERVLGSVGRRFCGGRTVRWRSSRHPRRDEEERPWRSGSACLRRHRRQVPAPRSLQDEEALT